MKLEKLYTLSQFVEHCVKQISIDTGIHLPGDVNSNNVNEWNTKSVHALGYILKYNKFLKQPLTKEMFVNPLTRPLLLRDFQNPTRDYLCEKEYAENMPIWEEAEKKVIFKGWYEKNGIITNGNYSCTISGKIFWLGNGESMPMMIISLEELISKIRELEIQNVDL